jgi:hypothetical protein
MIVSRRVPNSKSRRAADAHEVHVEEKVEAEEAEEQEVGHQAPYLWHIQRDEYSLRDTTAHSLKLIAPVL